MEAAELPRVAFYGGRKLAEKFARLEEMERQGPVDVFVVGPSHVDQGFDAGAFGEVSGTRAFNMGVQGTDMYFQSILLRDMLLAGPLNERAPKAVLWALRDEALTRSNINRQYLGSTAVSYAAGPLGGWALALGRYLPQFQRRRVMDWLRELSSSMRRSAWESAGGDARAELRSWMEPLDEFGRTVLSTNTRQERQPDGDREDREDEERGERPTGSTRFMGQDYSIDLQTAEAHVLETLRLLRARGIAVWFFLTPYHESVCVRSTKQSEMLLTGANEKYYDWLNGLSRDFEAPIVDMRYCAELSGQVPYFFDSRHLNSAGAAPLARILGEIFSGKRPLPAVWSGVPASAQFEFMFGKLERGRVPLLALGEPHGLDSFHGVRHDGRLLDAYASFRVEHAGKYRVVLLDAGPKARPALYVRFGGAHYRHSEPPPKPRREEVVLEAQLQPGEHLLELHGVDPKRELGLDQILVDAVGP